MASAAQANPDTPVTIKVTVDGVARRFKLPLRDVGINVLESKLRTALDIPADADAVFERYSDSAGSYVILDQANTAVYKQLYRAAKAKLKLKLRVTIKRNEPEEEKQGPKPATVTDEAEEESHPSVEATDTERLPEEILVSSPFTLPATAADPVAFLLNRVLTDPASPPPAAVEDEAATLNTSLTETPKDSVEEALKETTTTVPSEASPCTVDCPSIRSNYAVCCNSCDKTIPDAHYHCSTCDDGDFDLCQECVNRGVTCKGTSHWLIKRFLKNGVIINSTTERLAPKSKPKVQSKPVAVTLAPAAPERIIPVFNDFLYSSIRTCNCCVAELPESDFVHCTTCDDYDLCNTCFAKNRHGHHPKHAFVPVVQGTRLDPEIARRLAAGRGEAHNALCDGCDKFIKGVRHKCLDCPDWDYCSGCVVNAGFIHPGHRFVPIYEPLQPAQSQDVRAVRQPTHVGICCDGPHCADARIRSSFIRGDRFKCAVCHDTDFCAVCEASPVNNHNRTHPLIKFKTPVRHVSVTTTGENQNGRQMPAMGDRPSPRRSVENSPVVEASPPPSLFTGVQTVVDVKPSEPPKVEEKQPTQAKEENIEEKPLAATTATATTSADIATPKPVPIRELAAAYVRDTVQDGTVFGPDHVFEQTWILRNTGDHEWPAGCSVKFVSGDYMGSLDSSHPAATRDVESSCESTISYDSIRPGEEFPFTVLLRTPRRAGRVVSYWRLTTKDGHMFGHRLWCDVVVEEPKVVLPPAAAAEHIEEEEKKPLVSLVVEPEVNSESSRLTAQEKGKMKCAEVVIEPEAEPEHSQMIFPKLEKESPVASVCEEPKAESVSAQADEYEDCGEFEWQDYESEEAFMTDEEYDVLDASDEEFHLGDRSKQK